MTSIARARTYAKWFIEGACELLHAHFADALRAKFPLAALRALTAQQLSDRGTECALIVERFSRGELGAVTYHRISSFTESASLAELVLNISPDGAITGLRVCAQLEEAPSARLGYRTCVALRLPFSGIWTVLWGGRSFKDNFHVVSPTQRFAYDFVITVDGCSHAAEGLANSDYYCWGEPIFSPARGTVVAAVDGIDDCAPGVMNRKAPLGNHLIIDHGNQEFSWLAHLRRGSIAVCVGQAVVEGDVLGSCGNSGHSSEPHLHYHLQTTSSLKKGEGLPAQFENYVVDGQFIVRGEPLRYQRVAPAHRID